MAKWIEYTGSDEQIAEIGISLSYSGYITRNAEGIESKVVCTDTTHYLICEPHPYADMVCQQAWTGQPVWVKMKSSTYWVIAMRGFDLIYQDHVVSVIKSTTPDWNIPNAEYSFTEFKEEV